MSEWVIFSIASKKADSKKKAEYKEKAESNKDLGDYSSVV